MRSQNTNLLTIQVREAQAIDRLNKVREAQATDRLFKECEAQFTG
jgi:hypothetical protein